MNTFSIVVCCYNSVGRIEETLRKISMLEYDEDKLEVILVDNASKDETSSIAREVWDNTGVSFGFRIVKEPLPGHMNARKKGVEESNNDYIIFVDDDNRLDSKYVFHANEILQKDPSIGLLGGKIEGDFEKIPPRWMYCFYPFRSVVTNLAITDDKTTFGYLKDSRDFIYGAGSIYKGDVLKFIFCKMELLLKGRTKGILTSGDDYELSLLIKKAGYKLYRSSDLLIEHFITANRIDWHYFHRLYEGFGYTDPLLNIYFRLMESEDEEKALHHKPSYTKAKNRYNVLNILAKTVSLLSLEKFKKNKLHLLATAEKGRMKFIEKNRNQLEAYNENANRNLKLLESFYERQ